MSSGTVSKEIDVTLCDYCDKEITYYSERHASVDILKVNENPLNKREVSKDTKSVFWWRERKVTFGRDSYDFHGDCFVKLMDRLEELKPNIQGIELDGKSVNINTTIDHTLKLDDIVSFKGFEGMREDIAYVVKENEIMGSFTLVEYKPL